MQQRLGSSSEDVLDTPLEGGRNLSEEERRHMDLSETIPGWGVDLDPKLRPGIPRDRAPYLGSEALYPSFEQQVPEVKIFKSTEHGKLTPVFGTTCPPKGVSGWVRSAAYKLSEGRIPHWLLLMTADRIDMVEGLFEDLISLRIPNLPKEMGWKAEFKYNKAGVAKKFFVLGGVSFAVLALSKYLDDRRKIRPKFNYPSAGDSRAELG